MSFMEIYLPGRKWLLIDRSDEPFLIKAVKSDKRFSAALTLSKQLLFQAPNLLLSNEIDNIANIAPFKNYSGSQKSKWQHTNIGFPKSTESGIPNNDSSILKTVLNNNT